MCLSFDHAAAYAAAEEYAAQEALAAGKKALQNAHDSVDCRKIQITLLFHKNGSSTVLCYLPLASDTAVLAMYPVESECIGEKGEYLIACEDLPCNASNLEAWFEPGKFVPIPQHVEVPVYRSLGGGGGGNSAARKTPVVHLPPSVCIKNANGSTSFVLHTSEFALSDKQLTAAIEAGTYANRQEYLTVMGKACFEALTLSMDENKVDKSNIFAMRQDDSTVVDPCAMIGFLNELFPNLRPGCDMLVCVPPFEDGNPKMNGAFSFAFHYPEAREKYPLLGLVHNVDDSTTSTEQEVEGEYYVLCNGKPVMTVKNSSTRVITEVGLCNSHEFLPYDKIPRAVDMDEPLYREMEPDDSNDYKAWITACGELQGLCKDKIWETIGEACKKMGLPDFDTSSFHATNLVKRFFPKDTVSFSCGKDANETAGGSVLKRMKVARKEPGA